MKPSRKKCRQTSSSSVDLARFRSGSGSETGYETGPESVAMRSKASMEPPLVFKVSVEGG